MVTIKNNQYTMDNVRRKREPMEFVLAITRIIKTTNMSVYNQITLIYIGINVKFRRDLCKLTEKFTRDTCFQNLKNNKKIGGE